MTVSRSGLRFGMCIMALALIQLPSRDAWAQRTTTTKKTTPSQSSSASAVRSKPVSTAAGRAVNSALQKALATSSVQNAMKAEVLRQLRVRRPLAIVNGYWVGAIDLTAVYNAPAVRPVLLAALGVNGPQLIKDAAVSADRLVMSFAPTVLGRIILPEFNAGVTGALGVDAVKAHMTDFVVGPVLLVVVVGASALGFGYSMAGALGVFLDWLFAPDPVQGPTDPGGDFDGDGLSNAEDPDDDNDGVSDDKDNYPYDKDRSICDCGRPAVSLATTSLGDFLPSFILTLNATQTQRAKARSLGAVGQGQAGSLAILF